MDLTQTHPDLLHRIGSVLNAMQATRCPMKICQATRTVAQQAALYAQGRSTPGLKVTNRDGVRYISLHQLQPDGYSHAVDCCFLGDDPFSDSHPWGRYADELVKAGLVAGGHWPKPDRPHAELPSLPAGTLRA